MIATAEPLRNCPTLAITKVRVENSALDQGEPHPLRGFTGTVIETFSGGEGGTDCLLALDCSHQEVARSFRLGLDDWEDYQDIFRDVIHDPDRPLIEEILADLEIL